MLVQELLKVHLLFQHKDTQVELNLLVDLLLMLGAVAAVLVVLAKFHQELIHLTLLLVMVVLVKVPV